MENKKYQNASSSLMDNLFNGSIALIMVNLTIVTLFQVTGKAPEHLVDECFSASSGLYIFTVVFSYMYSLNQKHYRFKLMADYCFRLAIISTIISILVLTFELQTHA